MTLYVGGLLGDSQRAVRRSNVLNDVARRAYIAIGATGAPTVTSPVDASGGVIGCTRSGAGTYAITFPVLAAVATSVPVIRAWVVLSAAATVAQANFTAFAPTSGTATMVTALNAAGTAVDPANGDVLCIELTAGDPTA